ncbi:tRNA uridine-5-carboxymethylaminomethyl(34) synthesis GTPase MnmE [Corticibacter populi]|uniref:tRNA modification GTPase MnmE n=1 Tax=Corticibacter populi TaxID=1550736 RepID=A0A3M6QUB0_9BURK|nr:tRNA uridine-5-carboxymethylaminomethyl(34) synthesis GTPase MnmE [Corticibacter populi]RMX06062.1 tRNA uridine-5-carboxymethylaminomethyl(34) synthesis GTPase MnmE [Corticibacter populi]RZS30709.1 tRNA modification GTPase trmE [Corticibacter populi]
MTAPPALPRHPIIAIATAPGRGGIGVIRISGPQLRPWAEHYLGQPLRARHAHYLPFPAGDGTPLDHGLALYFPAPHSYTGEDVLELQAHGGPVLLQMLLARCLESAAERDPATGEPRLPRLRLAEPGEFTQRAFLNDKMDLAQAEAVADLIDASTETAARSAGLSLSGAFSQAIGSLREQLIHLRMLVEATLDFPEEEDVDFLQEADAAGQLQQLQAQLESVRRRARQGALLREGLKIVIAGQPNAGKSSLLNALAGAELAIVTPIAGTTRDKVEQTIQIDGVPLHIVDTAGLRETEDTVERIGVERAWHALEGADAVLFLHDLTQRESAAYQQGDAQIRRHLAKRIAPATPVLHVWNKLDCVTPAAQAAVTAALPAGEESLFISAQAGTGLDVLRQRLLELAGFQSLPEGVFMARARHLRALAEVGEHLNIASAMLEQPERPLDLLAEELRLAQTALNAITGEFTSDDLLGVIFSSFCIGK